MHKRIFACLIGVILFAPLSRAYDEKQVCKETQARFSRRAQLRVQCRRSYQLYCHSSLGRGCGLSTPFGYSGQESEPVRIAGFNVFNLGKEMDPRGLRETFFKDPALLARAISEFDLVGTVELKHFAKGDRAVNEGLDEAIKKAPSRSEKRKLSAHYVLPHYLQLLKELHKRKDGKTWALILSNELQAPDPEDTLNNELAGFFVRLDKVRPAPTPACPGRGSKALACPAPEGAFPVEVSRKPFLAGFEAAGRKFTYAAWHTRYNPPYEKDVLEELLSFFDVKPLGIVRKEERARFAEVRAVAEYLGALRSRKKTDVLLYADFNLPAPKKDSDLKSRKQKAYRASWLEALKPLPGYDVFLNNLSTLGFKSLSEKFDHFVFSPRNPAFEACETDGGGKRSGFLDFTRWSLSPKKLSALKADLASRMKAGKDGLERRYSDAMVNFLGRGYQDRVLKPRRGPLQRYRELVSDHLPVFMTCGF